MSLRGLLSNSKDKLIDCCKERFKRMKERTARVDVHRGYYTVARTYEVYLLVEKIFHKRAQRTSEIFFPREDKFHMFKPTRNFLFITHIRVSVSKIRKTRRKTKECRQRYLH